MKKLICLVAVILLLGCAGGGEWLAMERKPSTPCEVKKTRAVSYDKNYKIGEHKSAFIGQEIIRVKEYTHINKSDEFINSFIAPKNFIVNAKYRIENFQIKIEANKKYQIDEMITIDSVPYFLIKILDETDKRYRGKWGLLVSCDGTVFESAIYSYFDEMLFFPSVITFTPAVQNVKFIAQKDIKDTKDFNVNPGMMYELIYTGKNDVSLNATYKEYSSSDLARPAFFQNLTYQANAKQIRFKDFLIQIHNVTNEQITYTVLEDGLK